MKYTFNSVFASDIVAYVKLRCSLGNEEDTYARRLQDFDHFCSKKYPDEENLTQELAEDWCTLRSNEKTSTLQLRSGILKGFSKYLVTLGKTAYVIPDGFAGKQSHFIPYLYTDDELKIFFASGDTLPPHKLSPLREYVIPVIFRMLYCCGLRPQEVRHLTVEQVDLDEGILHICDSKRNKDRQVAMSDDLTYLCIRYDKVISKKIHLRRFFFENPNGGEYSAAWLQHQFFKCWKRAGITFDKSHHPRVYDWRHNFATHKIIQWMNDGLDIMNLLPYLSTYMGHESIEYTAYYIHLVPDHLKSSELINWNCNVEVPTYED